MHLQHFISSGALVTDCKIIQLNIIQYLFAGGVVMDMGCYTIQFAQMVYKHEKPEVVATAFLNDKSKNLRKEF